MKYFRYFLICVTISFINIRLYYNDSNKYLRESLFQEKLIFLQRKYNREIMLLNTSLALTSQNTSTKFLHERPHIESLNITRKVDEINVSYIEYEKLNMNETYKTEHEKISIYSEIENTESNVYGLTKQYQILSNYLKSMYEKGFSKRERNIVIIIIERNRTLEFDILRSLIRSKKSCNSLYKIVHVEQSKNCLFNRGLLANVGFEKAYDTWNDIERIVVHDTDMFPESTMCYNEPYHAPVIHYATRVSQFNDKLPYKTYFGGVIGFIPSVYKKINGFSNSFWGWGGEDDDIYNRVVNTGFNVFSSTSGRFLSTCHDRDKSNVNRNVEVLNNGSRTNDGLSNLNDIVSPIVTKLSEDEVHIVVNVNSTFCKIPTPPPPPQFRPYYSSNQNMYNSYNYKSSYSNSNYKKDTTYTDTYKNSYKTSDYSYKKDTNPTNSYKYERNLYGSNLITTPKTKESLNKFSKYKEQTNKIYTPSEKIKKESKKTLGIF